MKLSNIIEGWRNDSFPPEKLKDIILKVHTERMSICKLCIAYSEKGEGCVIPGTAPCCNKNIMLNNTTSGCGCPLNKKTKCLSCECPIKKWEKVITEEEEKKI